VHSGLPTSETNQQVQIIPEAEKEQGFAYIFKIQYKINRHNNDSGK
jgi:hypothetical protein